MRLLRGQNVRGPKGPEYRKEKLEARAGIEPAYKDLQSSA